MATIPKHVAIIMDGNRRWAKKQGKSILEGHNFGEKRIEPIIDKAIEMGIPYLTFWAFSTQNWLRSKREVLFLISLLRHLLDEKVDRYHLKNVKMNFIGNLSKFPEDIRQKLQYWMNKTVNNNKITVNLGLNYGGREEIVRAINKWHEMSKVPAQGWSASGGKVQSSKLTESDFKKYLDTAGQPDPDLLIRTGGEQRLSGFLLWQLEYTELYFTDVYWPDFTPQEFVKAIDEYIKRQRRFGK